MINNKYIKMILFFMLLIFLVNSYSNVTYSKILLDSDTIAEIAEQISNSVVNIDTSREIKEADIKKKTLDLGSIELHIPEILPQPEAGTGSGVVIRKDGYILTN